MYTKQVTGEDFFTGTSYCWSILDPQGDYIAGGLCEEEADALLSHLNR